MVTKRSHILKQTCSFQLQGGLSLCDLFVTTRPERINPPIQIYPNKIKNRIVFKIKTGYILELLSPETMKLLRRSKKDVDKDKDGEDIPKRELLKPF